MNQKENLKARKQIQREASAIIAKEVGNTKAAKRSETFNKKHKSSTASHHYDTLHVLVHGRTAQEVKDEYVGQVPKSLSALEILRRMEPKVAKQVEKANAEFVNKMDAKQIAKDIRENLKSI